MIGRLADWGADTVFGLPGDGTNGIMEGLRRTPDRVRFVLVHDGKWRSAAPAGDGTCELLAARMPGHRDPYQENPGS